MRQRKLAEINQISKTSNVLLNMLFIVVIALFFIYPFFIIIGSSLTDNKTIILQGYNMIPQQFSTEAYRYVFMKSSKILHAYLVTIMTTTVGTLLGVTMMAMYAYPISRPDLRYRKFFSLFAYVTFIFSGGLVPWFFVYTKVLGLSNSYWVLIMPYLVNVWYIVILRTFFATGIPQEVIESAKIDGAGEFRIFVSIVTRLAVPGLATVALFTTLLYWNDFQLPLYFSREMAKYNIQRLLQSIMENMEFMAQDTHSARIFPTPPVEAARMAMCVLGTGPMLIAYPFFQRYFVKGLTLGAVKG